MQVKLTSRLQTAINITREQSITVLRNFEVRWLDPTDYITLTFYTVF